MENCNCDRCSCLYRYHGIWKHVHERQHGTCRIILSGVAAIIIGFVIEFFELGVDYSRTELTQFEDDEYIYYVKAVPKALVSESKKV